MRSFVELARDRFSARKFTNERVGEEDLKYVMEAVRLAPSACNRQPWKFVVARSEEALRKVRLCYDREWMGTAPVVVIAMKNKRDNWVRPADGKAHGDVDVAIAVEHLCLAATERGLGSCWVCNYDVKRMAELFPEGKEWETVALIPLGHVAEDCPRGEKVRKGTEEITKYV